MVKLSVSGAADPGFESHWRRGNFPGGVIPVTSNLALSFIFVTLHHEMSRSVPHGHFQVFIFSESKFYAIYNGETHFQIRVLVAELHVFKYGGTTFGTFEKACFKC